MLEPEVDSRKRQTVIHRGEEHPHFDEHFKFPVSRDQLQGKQLVLQVLDFDRYSHNDIIGEVRINIDEIDMSKSVEVKCRIYFYTMRFFEYINVYIAQIWGDVLRAKKPPEDRPELLISLTHLPQAERISITIMKARNLSTEHDPFVRVGFAKWNTLKWLRGAKIDN